MEGAVPAEGCLSEASVDSGAELQGQKVPRDGVGQCAREQDGAHAHAHRHRQERA